MQNAPAEKGNVKINREGSVAVITMNDPERSNAFSIEMRRSLLKAFKELFDTADPCRAIVLAGSGGRFCSGYDLSEMSAGRRSIIEARESVVLSSAVAQTIIKGGKPVIAAIEGCCFNAGVSLASACDVAVGSVESRYSCAFVKTGLIADVGLLWTLPQKIGHGKTRTLLLTGESFSGEDAARFGLINYLAEPGHCREKAIELAVKFEAIPPATQALLKSCLVNAGASIADAKRLEVDVNPIVRQTSDHKEAVSAFMEKRKPVFTGD